MRRQLTLEEWENVFRNLIEERDNATPEDRELWEQEGKPWVEVTWLEGNGVDTHEEWVLNVGCEVLEDGFKTEWEAMKRLQFAEKWCCPNH